MMQQKNILLRATVTEAVADGVKLRFDGELAARQKTYACMGGAPSVDDKVCVAPMSGTYVVLGVFGGTGGGGDMLGPASSVLGHIPVFADTSGKVLQDGLALDTDISSVSASDDSIPSAKAVKTYVDGKVGAWANWTPTLGGATKGNGTVVARYCIIGNNLFFEFSFVLGSTSAITGDFNFTLPITVSGNSLCFGQITDVGITAYDTLCGVSSSKVYVRVKTAGGTYVSFAITSSTVPMTWGTNDAITVSGNVQI